jgi:hypothetical protein
MQGLNGKNYYCMHPYSLCLITELQAEVSDVCGESDGTFEEIVEKVEEDIEDTSE